MPARANTFDFRFFPQEYGRFRGDVLEHLVSNVLPRSNTLLDPMSGTASLLPYCQIRGIATYYSDILPVHYFVNRAKTINVWRDAKKFEKKEKKSIDRILFEYFDHFGNTGLLISDSWFHDETLSSLVSSWKRSDEYDDNISTFLKAVILLSARSFSSSWSSFSNTYWHRPGGMSFHKPLEEIVTDVLSRFERLWKFYEDNTTASYKPPLAYFSIGDARTLPWRKKVDTIITSPPFPNRFDYSRMFSPELFFLSEIGLLDYDDVINKQIATNSVRGYYPTDNEQSYVYSRSKSLQDYLEKVSKLGKKGENNYYFRYFIRYYIDLFNTIDYLCSKLAKGGSIYLVVQNNMHRGELNALSDYCADCLTANGLRVDNTFQRLRTHQGIRNISKEHSVFVKRHHELIIKADLP